MILRSLCFLLLVTAGSSFYANYDYKPAAEALYELYEEKYNPYYRTPEDCSNDELIELIEESLTTIVEMLSEKSHVMKFLNKELKNSNRAILIFINKLFLAIAGKGEDDPLELVKSFVKEHFGDLKEVFPNITDFFQLCQDLIFTEEGEEEEDRRRKRDVEDQMTSSISRPIPKLVEPSQSTEATEIDPSLTPEEVLAQVDWLNNDKALEIKKMYKKNAYRKPVSKHLRSEKYETNFQKGNKFRNNHDFIRGSIGGFTDTISLMLENLANSKSNIEAEQLRLIQKKFKDLSKEMNKKLSELGNDY